MIKSLARFLLVKDSEYGKLFYFFGIFLLIGAGMAVGRGTTDALFFKRYGIEYLPVMYMIVSVMLFAVTTAYAAFADRIPAERFFNILFVGGAVLLIMVWWIISNTEFAFVYPMYFVIFEIGSELLPIHAALYLSQNMDTLQSKRLSPLIFAGAQIGTIAGGIMLALLAPVVGTQNVLLLWGVIFLASIILIRLRHMKTGVSCFFRAPKKNEAGKLTQAVTQLVQGVKFTRDSTLLRAASFALFFMVIAFYILCYSVNRIYTETFQTEESLTAFFGLLTAANSLLALLLQIFVTNKVIHKLGVKKVNLLFPVTSLASYGALLLSFALPSAILGSINKDAIMTAFRNPVRNMFFNALPNYMQGRARAMSVAVVMPLALVVCGAILWIVQQLDNPVFYLSTGVLATIMYFYFNIRMNKAYANEIITHLKEKLFLPDEDQYRGLVDNYDDIFPELVKGVRHEDEDIVIAFSTALIRSFPDEASDIVLERIKTTSPATTDRLIRLLAPLSMPHFPAYLWNTLDSGDSHLESTALQILFDIEDKRAMDHIPRLLEEKNPRLKSMGVYGVMRHSLEKYEEKANNTWREMLLSTDVSENLAGLVLAELVPQLEQHWAITELLAKQALPHLLESQDKYIVKKSLSVLSKNLSIKVDNIESILRNIYAHPDHELRILCVKCFALLPKDVCIQMAGNALEDNHPKVRSEALNIIKEHSNNLNEQLSWWLAVENKGSPRAQKTMLETLLEHGAPHHIMETVASAKIIEGIFISHAAMLLLACPGKDYKGMEVLKYALEERRHELIDLALIAMNAIEDRDMLGIIRAGIQSGDVRHMANACEALRNIDNQKLAGFLGDIIQFADSDYSKKSRVKPPFSDIQGMLQWCRQLNDPWLKECSEYALST